MCTSFIFVRLSHMGAVPLATYRLFLSAVVTLPLFHLGWSKHRPSGASSLLRGCIGPGAALGVHLILWNIGCRMTSAANGTLIVNLSPIALPFALALFAKERINRGELVATLFALGGLGWLAISDYHGSREHLMGDGVCLAAMLVLACYLALARRSAPRFPNPWLFNVPVYASAALTCAAWLLLTGETWPKITDRDAWCLAGLVLFPTILGHGLALMALGRMRGQIVGLFGSAQFIPAAFWGWLIFQEKPGASFILSAALVMVGVIFAIRSRSR
jgi:drug/metabolite transporter (DMT)-like permease